MSRKRIVMVGTDPGGQGGIAAVLEAYREWGFFERWGVEYLVSHRVGSQFTRTRSFLTCALRLLVLLATGRVALVHAHVASKGSFWRKSLLLAMARAFGVTTVFHLHGGRFHKFHEASSRWTRRWIVRALQSSTVVVALSDAWAATVKQLAPLARVAVVLNPTHLPVRHARSNERIGRVLFLGRVSAEKGIFDLLQALALARGRAPALHLQIGGDGDLDAVRAAARAAGVAEAVELLGWVRGPTKEACLAEAELFVLPSHDEGLPMALLECMARGKAVVSTPVGGIPQALRDGEDGLLVPPGAPERLAEALLRLHQDAALREQLGDSARERVRAHYATDTVIARLEALYRELGLEPVR